MHTNTRRLATILLLLLTFVSVSESSSIETGGPAFVVAAEPGTYNELIGGGYSEPNHRFFVLWRHEIYDQSSDSYFSNLRGRFVDPNGTQAPEKVYSFPLTNQSPADRPEVLGAALSYNTTLNNYFVYWGHWTQSRQKNGGTTRIIHADGKPAARQLILPETDLHRPSIAYNPVTHHFLLASDGVNLLALDNLGRVAGTSTSSGDNGIYAQVLADPESNGYFLFWQRMGGDTMFQQVSSSGELLNSPIKVATNPADNYPISIAYNPSAKQFLVLIGHGHIAGSQNSHIRSLLFDRNFKLIRKAQDIVIQEGLPAVVFIQTPQTGYAMAYQKDGFLWAKLLNRAGLPMGKTVQIGPSTAAVIPSIVYAPSLKKLLVIWLGSGIGHEDVYARFLDLIP